MKNLIILAHSIVYHNGDDDEIEVHQGVKAAESRAAINAYIYDNVRDVIITNESEHGKEKEYEHMTLAELCRAFDIYVYGSLDTCETVIYKGSNWILTFTVGEHPEKERP